MRKLMIITAFCLGSATGAWATPSLTADQSSRLQAALDAQGCAGGNVNVGESGFEIVGAKCGGGRIYDLVFDHDYRMLKKDARN
jgi:hypothetical protein